MPCCDSVKSPRRSRPLDVRAVVLTAARDSEADLAGFRQPCIRGRRGRVQSARPRMRGIRGVGALSSRRPWDTSRVTFRAHPVIGPARDQGPHRHGVVDCIRRSRGRSPWDAEEASDLASAHDRLYGMRSRATRDFSLTFATGS